MDSGQAYMDQLLFAVLPYLSVTLFFLVTIQRYRAQKFSYSSLSSQFLENQQHFWALVPFHYGILIVLAGHIVAFLIPRHILAWNAIPVRLYILEISALIFGILTVVGLWTIVVRRWAFSKARTVTSLSDWILYGLLIIQGMSGVYVAVIYPWGSSWFAATASPYLWSIAKLNPEIAFVAAASVDGQTPHRQCLRCDRVFPLHKIGAHSRRSESVSVETNTGCEMELVAGKPADRTMTSR